MNPPTDPYLNGIYISSSSSSSPILLGHVQHCFCTIRHLMRPPVQRIQIISSESWAEQTYMECRVSSMLPGSM